MHFCEDPNFQAIINFNLRTLKGKNYTLEEKYQPKIFSLKQLERKIKW